MDGPPPQEEDFTSIPIADRLSHKNWKARVSAYDSLIKSFQTSASDTDPVFKPYVNNTELLKRFATDANAVAQEKGVECLVALVKFAGETVAKTRDGVVPALVDKCLGSTRLGTKNQAIELILQYVEVENGAAGVVGDILPGLSAKQPKTVAACVLTLKEIVRLFGTSVAQPPAILKALPKIFSHNDKTVRSEGTNLAHTLYQYIGTSIDPWLNDLKPVQVKELKEAFEGLDKDERGKGSVKPDRLTRAHARELETAGAPDEADQVESTEEAPLDPREFAEAVDIIPKLPQSFHPALKSSKWKERKEALDELATMLTSSLRIKDVPELSELLRALASRIASDANINCVMVAATCVEELAKGLMKAFAKYREIVVPQMLERLKERKTSVTDVIGTALDAVFATVSLQEIIPDIENALKSKNPQVKEGSLKFLGRCITLAVTPIPQPQIKPLSEALAGLLEDSFESARNEAATCLGCLMKMVGERPLNAIMESLAEVRKTKVKEAYEKSSVKCKVGTVPSRAPPSTTGPSVVKKPNAAIKPPPTDDQESAPPKKEPAKPPMKPVKKPSAAPASAVANKKVPPTAAKQTKPSGQATPGGLDTFKYKHTPEEAETLVMELIPSNILTDLGDANWKTRLAALEELTTWVDNEINELDAEVIVRALAKRGWAEKNFQVSAKIYGIFSLLAEKSSSFGRSCAALCVPHLTEKLGDLKLKKPASDSLIAFAEKTSLQFVLNQAYEPLSKQKAPKVLADSLTWVSTALTEFGIAGITLRSLIEFLKASLQNSNAAVRTNATKTLVTVKLYAGPGIKDLLEDLNPQLLNTIQSEFDKAEGSSVPEPSRTSADLANLNTTSTSNIGKARNDPLDDLFPRVEIDGLLKGTTILADSKSDAWKTKKEALEALQAILDQGSNKRLKGTMGDIGQILKARVTDTNKAVQSLALDIVSRIASGMGKPFERYSRLFVLPVSSVLADQKAPIRATALQTLTAIATACDGVDSMISGFTTALETSNPLQKGTLLQWLADWFNDHETATSVDLQPWSNSILSSLDDRNSEVRKGAQVFLPILVKHAGFDYVMQQANSLKPASRASAAPLIQAARPVAVQGTNDKNTTKTSNVHPPATEDIVGSETAAVPQTAVAKPATKLAPVRRKLPLGLSKAENAPDLVTKATMASVNTSSTISATPIQSLLFTTVNVDPKKTRLGKDPLRWVNEGGPTRKDLAEYLQNQMEPHVSKDLIAKLFSHDHNAVNDHVSGLTMIAEFFTSACGGDDDVAALCIANLDLPLKYVSIKSHEPQPNLISKCLDVIEAILSFIRSINYQLMDNEALCFVPTMVFKLGDAREQVRSRVQQNFRNLPTVYAYSRVFQILLEHGLKAKVAKTRQGTLDELGYIFKKSGIGACEPSKSLPLIGSMISDKDSQVRKSALTTLSEVYTLVGEKIWSLVGNLSPKDKTQLEERLRRVPGPSSNQKQDTLVPQGVARLNPGIPRPTTPVTAMSKIGRPASPAQRAASPVPPAFPRADSPLKVSRLPASLPSAASMTPAGNNKPKSLMPSKLGRPRPNLVPVSNPAPQLEDTPDDAQPTYTPTPISADVVDDVLSHPEASDDITVTISSILSNDASRSVDALKKIQKILSVGSTSTKYHELAEHTEGLVETITLQMAHVFERPEDLLSDDNFRLAKHLIQTLNNFCDHPFLAESLTVDILTSLLEELTLRLLETDDSPVKKVKDLSRFINMIILRLFATGRRMSIFRALFALLLQIVKPFPSNGTLPESKESKVAELVLKCVWKLARNIPQDLAESHLDPVDLFPAIEHFLQSVPPNEWRARATSKVPCGDMPLRTIKIIIQHIVGHYGDATYELLSASFDDPSATIVYPYVYRIVNSVSRTEVRREAMPSEPSTRPVSQASQASSRPISPQESTAIRRPLSHRTNPSQSSSLNGSSSPNAEDSDPDAQLLTIIGQISSETTGALHKEGITKLHQFLKTYPQKRPRVEKMLESTGAAFRKYINRALASRAAEDQERDAAVADTLSKLEYNRETNHQSPANMQSDTTPNSPRASLTENTDGQDKLSRLHDIFQYRSSASSQGRTTPSLARTSFS